MLEHVRPVVVQVGALFSGEFTDTHAGANACLRRGLPGRRSSRSRADLHHFRRFQRLMKTSNLVKLA
jgi:hypothetical protein